MELKKYPIYQVDAFTDQVFGGNPAAVVLLDRWLSDEAMQAVAAENNLAETAFVVVEKDGHGLRWFTPSTEVDLCGHATLAAAHVLFHHVNFPGGEVYFRTLSGILTVRREGDLIAMDFPARPAKPVQVKDELITALAARPEEVLEARDVMAVFSSEEEIRSLTPDLAAVARLETFGVIVTAPGENCDFVSRFFAPQVGIPEDPVTGSAHCTLVPYWSEKLGREKLTARQLSERGGELFCEMRDDRIIIAGKVADYLTGSILVP